LTEQIWRAVFDTASVYGSALMPADAAERDLSRDPAQGVRPAPRPRPSLFMRDAAG
jgi:hypothetical protein